MDCKPQFNRCIFGDVNFDFVSLHRNNFNYYLAFRWIECRFGGRDDDFYKWVQQVATFKSLSRLRQQHLQNVHQRICVFFMSFV